MDRRSFRELRAARVAVVAAAPVGGAIGMRQGAG